MENENRELSIEELGTLCRLLYRLSNTAASEPVRRTAKGLFDLLVRWQYGEKLPIIKRK